ncbi:hypothetical protein [Paenibacillus macquariensis]|uniref:Uncharacterized protein n=1 Tax=Paenibacillus macquariensis TaxID=948756 RepID=A0ABY1JV51_9BACL|nr:hypothetical protein [Paenibacillus macquariensis]MEC0090847.1 hypothetical protein [Paenibacillus macquariensis]OAB34584.1 hypothetical protein PMSM_12035 [Paenibacillus macquariensis subsp. macquariensis]SIQ82233.1 hypothetical protein SAMN05421578_104216 [Paenibacillus macquariensis]
MLDLASHVWSKLDGPFGSAENVPQLIKQLQKQYEEAVKDELYWEQLFHQNTIIQAHWPRSPVDRRVWRSS